MAPGHSHSGTYSRTARRARPLPHDWDQRRAAVKARDGACVWPTQGMRCGSTLDLEVDHIDRFGDDELDNLQLLCGYHHGIKTAREASAARWAKTRALQPKPRPHPGLL